MKKLFAALIIAVALFSGIISADESPNYPDWVWINSTWVYIGTENPPPPPPPINPPGTL